jgi:hypothetical protein
MSEKYDQLAKEAGEQMESKDDGEYFFSELETVPEYPKE